ncbi:MAG: YsnF/AvaK domain-containing protein [Bacteroidota bacterium]|nr:YsnF/AvaK domain-containing protein [Bacteroidota bacterium]
MKENKNFVRNPDNNMQIHDQGSGTPKDVKNSEEMTIPVIEESLHVDKNWVESGKVNISKTITEHQETIDVPLSHEEVNIERVQVNQYIDTLPPPVRYEGETMIIPVLREVVVKRVMLVEELRVTRKEVQTHEKQQVTLKKEEINIDRVSTQPETSGLGTN